MLFRLHPNVTFQTERSGPASPILGRIGADRSDTTFRSPESAHDVHSVAWTDCHSDGVPSSRIDDVS